MRRKFVLPAMVALGICALVSLANSTPSTLIWIPSTDIQADNTGHFGADSYAASKGQALMDYGLTFGAGKFEYGIDLLSINGIKDPVRLNTKYLVKDESKSMPRLTVGVYDYGTDAASNIYYALGSKTFSLARLTFGYGQGKKKVLGDGNNMLLLGVDKTINGKWWAAVDYQSGKSAFGALSAGVAYTFTKNTSLIAGYDWYNDKSLSNTFTLQLDTNF